MVGFNRRFSSFTKIVKKEIDSINAPKAFIGLMKGENFGKLLVKVKL